MPTYLMLTTLTEKGIQTLHANPARLREVNRDVEEMGRRCSTSGLLSASTTSSTSSRLPTTSPSRRCRSRWARGSAKLESLPLISVDDFLGTLT